MTEAQKRRMVERLETLCGRIETCQQMLPRDAYSVRDWLQQSKDKALAALREAESAQ